MLTLSRMSWAVDVYDSEGGVRTVPRGDCPSSVRRFCESIDRKGMSVAVSYAFVKNFCKSQDL